MSIPITLLVGFDRSGTSFISRLLVTHPKVNLLFQPFNSTEVHKTQWEVWDQYHTLQNDTAHFLANLLQGHLDEAFIVSDWHQKFSSKLKLDADHVTIIKDTKFHLKTAWLEKHFPEIQLWGIWRNPIGILCSLMRNDFYQKWYGKGDYQKAHELTMTTQILSPFRPFFVHDNTDTHKMALIIAVRVFYLVKTIGTKNWLKYEAIHENPSEGFAPFLKQQGLPDHSFENARRIDYNIAGKPFRGIDFYRSFFTEKEQETLSVIFQPLMGLFDS